MFQHLSISRKHVKKALFTSQHNHLRYTMYFYSMYLAYRQNCSKIVNAVPRSNCICIIV